MQVNAGEIICEAIRTRRRLSFLYKGSARKADPYILGYDADGASILSAVQVSGGSGRGFRSFTVRGLSDLAATDEKFFGNHPQYNPRDRLFHRIVCQV